MNYLHNLYIAALLLIAAVGLYGCAGSDRPTGPTSQLTVRLGGDMLPDQAEVDVFEGESCSQDQVGGSLGVLTATHRQLGAEIPAGERLSVQVRGHHVTAEKRFVCSVKISFLPLNGKHYELTYGFSPTGCTIRPTALVSERGGHIKRVPELTVLKNRVCKQ